jgi:ribosomal protein L44E
VNWTEARIKGFIIGVLRSGARRWPPKHEALKDAYVGKKENKKTKRKVMHYRCCICKEEFPSTFIEVDHKDPVVDPAVGFVDWNTFVSRLYCPKDNLQAICKTCHTKKTKEERDAKGKKAGKE